MHRLLSKQNKPHFKIVLNNWADEELTQFFPHCVTEPSADPFSLKRKTHDGLCWNVILQGVSLFWECLVWLLHVWSDRLAPGIVSIDWSMAENNVALISSLNHVITTPLVLFPPATYGANPLHTLLIAWFCFHSNRFWLSSVPVAQWMPSCWVSPFFHEAGAEFLLQSSRTPSPPHTSYPYSLHLEVPKSVPFFIIPPRRLLCGIFFPVPSQRASSICVITAAQISGSGQSTFDPWSNISTFLLPFSTVTKSSS